MKNLALPILFITRKEHKHTQKYVAQKLGISQQRYGLKETGVANFTLPEAQLLSEMYDMPIDELFSSSIKVNS